MIAPLDISTTNVPSANGELNRSPSIFISIHLWIIVPFLSSTSTRSVDKYESGSSIRICHCVIGHSVVHTPLLKYPACDPSIQISIVSAVRLSLLTTIPEPFRKLQLDQLHEYRLLLSMIQY